MVVLTPTSNVCQCVGSPDNVQEEHRRFILVRVKKCPTSSGGGGFCIILHRSAGSRGYKRVREGGAPKSQGVSGMCPCDSAGDLTRSRRVVCSCVCLVLFRCSWCLLVLSERSLHASFIVSRRCRVTRCWYGVRSLLEKEPRGLRRALSGGDVVCTVEAWRWYF
jgi:hypothetical protein